MDAAFAHIQIIAIAGAETVNSRQAIPRALRRTSLGVFVLYISVIFTVGLILPATHPGLRSHGGTALSSPFVIAAQEAGIVSPDYPGFILFTHRSFGRSFPALLSQKTVASVINAVVLTSAFSAVCLPHSPFGVSWPWDQRHDRLVCI